MTSFLEIPIETDPSALEEAVYDQLATAFPGWEPADGNLETWLVKSLTQTAANLAEVAVEVPREIFNDFGEKIVGVEPLLAASATGETTWTMIDDEGYTIPAGTQVAIAISGDESVAFEVLEEVQVAAGDTVTATGEVVISAVIEGEDANGLTADPSLIEALDFVDAIALEGTTSGGVDAEDPQDYLDRLTAEMRLLSPRPILPADVETLVRRVSEVGRAVAIDGYNPDDDTSNNERTVAVAVADEDGQPLSSPIKAEVDALLQAEREVNFVFKVMDPNYTTVKVTVTAVALEGYDTDEVDAAVVAAIEDYLSPANWGRHEFTTDTFTWRDVTTVRRFELVSLVDRVPGVDYITALTLAEQAGSLGTSDVTLDGPASLPEAGTITATISAP